ncbi:MAG TPA: TetR/AcrR family transcriptional regulator [Acidobacteriaceae bacterium]|nr:TetR/AcrR family transcriptional regulator [Acidobacteriaceae bacterium]
MARTKEFDPEKALLQAVDLFWTRGYARASLDDLMQAMGIARQSLYDTFGDKRQLYLRALALYRDQKLAAIRAHFPESKSVREGFRDLFFSIASENKSQLHRGCLLLSASLERGPEDEEIAEILREHQKSVEAAFREAIERAQKSNEISRKKDAADLARFFSATIEGMRILARTQPKRKLLESIADTALTVL